jgi:hypothetical protein
MARYGDDEDAVPSEVEPRSLLDRVSRLEDQVKMLRRRQARTEEVIHGPQAEKEEAW